jgi:probable F420-dependent oxidoreductase
MRIGVSVFATDTSWPIDDLAKTVETRGFASLTVPEHTHMPIDHSRHPGGYDLPAEYERTLDPFVALTMAAAVTSTLELMTGVMLLAQRDPIITAKEVATLDHLSQGRVTLGVGYGWNIPELENHGVPFEHRRDVVRDRLALMRTLWTQEIASTDTQYARLTPSRAWPKPVQQPHPPVLLGAGLGPRTLADLVAVCDGWLPLGMRTTAAGLPRLREAWQAAGRHGDPVIHVSGAHPDANYLHRLADLGVERASIWLPSSSRAEALPVLDELAAVAEAIG